MGLFAVLALTFAVCSVTPLVGGTDHVDDVACIETMTSTNCATVERGCGVLAIASLISLFGIGLLGLGGYWSGSPSGKVPTFNHWHMALQDVGWRLHDSIKEAMRRGIIHGQIYNIVYMTS